MPTTHLTIPPAPSHRPRRPGAETIAKVRSRRECPVLLLAVSGLAVFGAMTPARADFKVRSPIVTFREFEFEHGGSVTFDRNPARNRNQSYTYSIGAGVTSFWKIELEAETGASPDRHLSYNATTLENTFQLTQQGEYWADLGFFLEYSRGAPHDSSDGVKFGPILQKETPGFGQFGMLHTLNLFFEKDVGRFGTSRTGFAPAWQSRARLNPYFQPGFEIYGTIENAGRAGKFNDQRYNAGPMFAGGVSLFPYGKIKYEIGYLFGLTTNSPRGALRWLFEYEISF